MIVNHRHHYQHCDRRYDHCYHHQHDHCYCRCHHCTVDDSDYDHVGGDEGDHVINHGDSGGCSDNLDVN